MKNLTRCSRKNAKSGRFLDVCPEDSPLSEFMDARTRDYSIRAMAAARARRKPFFVVAGFYRPHLRWHVPRRFYELCAHPRGRGDVRGGFLPSLSRHVEWIAIACVRAPVRVASPRSASRLARSSAAPGSEGHLPSSPLRDDGGVTGETVCRARAGRYEGTRLETPDVTRRKPYKMPDVAWANEGCHTMTTAAHGTVAVHMDRPLKRAMVEDLRRGYFACASFVDALSGDVLDAADGGADARDTLVLLSSDHGFHLGEQASWTKHTLFELSARVPLLIRARGLAVGRTRHLVELTDIYRTLADLAGLPAPHRTVQGASLRPLLDAGARADADARAPTPVRNFSVTQYPRCPKDYRRQWDANCKRLTAADIPVMGYTMRVAHYRFTEWYHWIPKPGAPKHLDPPEKHIDTSRPPLATELYAFDEDAADDFDNLEVVNVADRPAAKCALDHLRTALARFANDCQHRNSPDCDASVDALAYKASTCVDPATRATFRSRPDAAGRRA